MKPDAGEPLTQDSFMIEMVSGSIAGMNRTTVIYALASGHIGRPLWASKSFALVGVRAK